MMEQEIRERVKKGDVFHFTYDFGSSTDLQLKVVGERQGSLKKGKVHLLARNMPPELLCGCGRPAQYVCTECRWDDDGFLCESCTEEHACGTEFLLPVVNSPRMGVGGYMGEDM